MKTVLSLGAGIQSTTLLLMACNGDFEKPDYVIFADTGWEPKAVYDHLERLKPVAKAAGIPLITVSAGNIYQDALVSQVRGKSVKDENGKVINRWASMPYFVLGPNGEQGQIRRQCTSEYKINPIEKYIKREILGLIPRKRLPKYPVVEKWIGISVDELGRASVSQENWYDLRYPLIEKKMNRDNCHQYLKKCWPHPVPRSACKGCPFHNNDEWRKIRNNPEEWQEVVKFDKSIRKTGGMRGELYLHADRVPLDQVDLSTAEDHGQIDFINECSGMCGV